MGQKGSSFERLISRQLSEWWTSGERDDCFWRTSQSGGRATTRSRKGKLTAGQCGDITATDPVGFPLIRFFTIECKIGYNRCDPIHLLDRSPKMAVQGFQLFLEQALAASEREGTPHWMIIHKRDHRVPMTYVPTKAFADMGMAFVDAGAKFSVRLKLSTKVPHWFRFHCLPLSKFLALVEPEDVRRAHATWSKQR